MKIGVILLTLSNGELMQIFGIIIAIGKSEHYSISIDYDTEFGYLDAYLWYSETLDTIEGVDKFRSRSDSFGNIVSKLKEWTEIIVSDRKSNSKEGQ